jgi:hypothetical protein
LLERPQEKETPRSEPLPSWLGLLFFVLFPQFSSNIVKQVLVFEEAFGEPQGSSQKPKADQNKNDSQGFKNTDIRHRNPFIRG